MRRANTKSIGVVALIIVSLSELAISQSTDSVELALTGEFLGTGPFPDSGQNWFAVSRTPSGIMLTETGIEVRQVPHPCSGTATRISAVDVKDSLFLVRGLPSLRAGSLDSVLEERRFIYPAEEVFMWLDSGTSFGYRAYGSATPTVGDILVSNYELLAYQGPRTQTLAEYPRTTGGGPPHLVWVGDLDRDDGPDVLLDSRRGDVGHNYVLFLSSGARNDQLLGIAAEFSVGGC